MSSIVNAISAFAAWLLGLFVKVFVAVWDLFTDLFIALADAFLQALAAVVSAIPAPDFLTQHGLQSAFSQLSGDVLFFLSVFNIGTGIAMLGSAFAFRMLRKVVTLFQW